MLKWAANPALRNLWRASMLNLIPRAYEQYNYVDIFHAISLYIRCFESQSAYTTHQMFGSAVYLKTFLYY